LFPRLAFTIYGLEQGWLAQFLLKVTGWGIMFIYGMVFRCTVSLHPDLTLDQLQQIWHPLSYIAIHFRWTTLTIKFVRIFSFGLWESLFHNATRKIDKLRHTCTTGNETISKLGSNQQKIIRVIYHNRSKNLIIEIPVHNSWVTYKLRLWKSHARRLKTYPCHWIQKWTFILTSILLPVKPIYYIQS